MLPSVILLLCQSVFGRDPEWDADFAARQLEKFKSIRPDPAVLAKISAMGDNSWLKLTPAGDEAAETGRSETPMVYMPDVRAFAMVSGCGGSGYSSDTWFYIPSANRWVQMWPNYVKGPGTKNNQGPYPAGRPATRCSLGLAYDHDRKLLVNHGGANAGNLALHTFTLEASTNRWDLAVKSDGPPRTADNCMGFVPGLGVVEIVPVGGKRPRYAGSETWVFRKKWERLDVQRSPPAGHNLKLVWNSVDRKLICHAGEIAELWAFDPATLDWENITPETKAPTRYRHGDAYDPFNNALITYGGKDNDTLYVFEFATRAWREMRSPDMPEQARNKQAMDFDTDLNVCVMKHGGQVLFYRYKRAADKKRSSGS